MLKRPAGAVGYNSDAAWTAAVVTNASAYGLEVKRSTLPGAGFGLFTTRRFADGEFLCPYYGEILTPAQTQERYQGYDLATYCVNVKVDRRRFVVDAEQTPCPARYANQCLSANRRKRQCEVNNADLMYVMPADRIKPVGWSVPNRALWLRAAADLPAGVEIFVDYGSQLTAQILVKRVIYQYMYEQQLVGLDKAVSNTALSKVLLPKVKPYLRNSVPSAGFRGQIQQSSRTEWDDIPDFKENQERFRPGDGSVYTLIKIKRGHLNFYYLEKRVDNVDMEHEEEDEDEDEAKYDEGQDEGQDDSKSGSVENGFVRAVWNPSGYHHVNENQIFLHGMGTGSASTESKGRYGELETESSAEPEEVDMDLDIGSGSVMTISAPQVPTHRCEDLLFPYDGHRGTDSEMESDSDSGSESGSESMSSVPRARGFVPYGFMWNSLQL